MQGKRLLYTLLTNDADTNATLFVKSQFEPCNSQECLKSKFKKNPKFHFVNIEKQMVPCKSTAKEVPFEWSHHRISSTDSKVRTTLHVSIIDSGSD